MKQYSPMLPGFAYAPQPEHREVFFTTSPRKAPPQGDPVRLQWFSAMTSESRNAFVLVAQGMDGEVVKALVGWLSDHCRTDAPSFRVAALDDIMESARRLPAAPPVQAEPPPRSSPAASPPAGEKQAPSAARRIFMQAVNGVIEANLDNERFRGADLARALTCCQMQLYRNLKKISRLSPANYIRRYRLHRGAHLLRQENAPVKEVCFAVGFGSLEYFSRSFKKEFGICPTAFRQDKTAKADAGEPSAMSRPPSAVKNVEMVQANVEMVQASGRGGW